MKQYFIVEKEVENIDLDKTDWEDIFSVIDMLEVDPATITVHNTPGEEGE